MSADLDIFEKKDGDENKGKNKMEGFGNEVRDIENVKGNQAQLERGAKTVLAMKKEEPGAKEAVRYYEVLGQPPKEKKDGKEVEVKPRDVNEVDKLDNARLAAQEKNPNKNEAKIEGFNNLMQTVLENPTLMVMSKIGTENVAQTVGFKGLLKDGKEIEPEKLVQLLNPNNKEKDIKGVDFQFSAVQKGEKPGESTPVEYTVSLQQMLREGVRPALEKAIQLNNVAGSEYEKPGKNTPPKSPEPQKPNEQKVDQMAAVKDIFAGKGLETMAANSKDLSIISVKTTENSQLQIAQVSGIFTVTHVEGGKAGAPKQMEVPEVMKLAEDAKAA